MDMETEYVLSETGNIVISACQALPEDDLASDCCAYYLRIENNSDSTIHLLSKEFNITDDLGNNYTDYSTGFKGELPDLEPGEYFEYADSAPLHTAFGVLYGSCQIMEEGASQARCIRIPALNLVGRSAKSATLH